MKEVAAAAGVPTARHATFGAGDEPAALEYLDTMPGFYVVKTDGLAAGKGVFVTESIADARDAVRSYLSGSAFGDAGRTVVIEEGMTGPELSLLAVCNGDPDGAVPLAPAQDFKRIGEHDEGPNTGGMGAYSPVPLVAPGDEAGLMEQFVFPTLRHLATQGAEYRGVLYAGLMFTPTGPKLVEYNIRFGDPECQVVLPRLTSDLAELLHAAAAGAPLPDPKFSGDACVGVVLAVEGYPASPRTGDVITGLDAAARVNSVTIFHAGTEFGPNETLVTAGGRVLDVVATGPTIADARAQAYEAAATIEWPGVYFRRDIAAQALVTSATAAGPHSGQHERALDTAQGPAVTRGRDEALDTPVLVARLALRDGVFCPMLRAVCHPRSPSSPMAARRHREIWAVSAIPGSYSVRQEEGLP